MDPDLVDITRYNKFWLELFWGLERQVNALSFNQSNAGQGRLTSFDSGGHGRGHSRTKQGGPHTAFDGGQFGDGFVLATSGYAPGPTTAVVPYQGGGPPNFYAPTGNCQGGQIQYHPPAGGYGAGGYGNAPPGGRPPAAPFLNEVKQYANWNACYLCGFDVPNSHTSMMFPTNLQKPLHDIYFTWQNAQQYINLGHPCCTKNRHKMHMPSMWWVGAANSVACEIKPSLYVYSTHSFYPTPN